MSFRGESSRAREEDEFIDIPMDAERPSGYTPVAPWQSESEEDEGFRSDVPQAVRGGVMRTGSQAESEDEPEEDPSEAVPDSSEEVPVEGSPAINTFQNDLLGEYSDLIDEQADIIDQRDARIVQLEGELQVSRQMEDQLVDEAYQHEVEMAELKAKVQQLEQSPPPSLGPTVQQLMLQNTHLRQAREQSDAREASLQAVYQATRAERDFERADRIYLEGAWGRAASRASMLEGQVRDGSARIDTLEYALDTSFARLRDRVRRYPRDSGHTRRTVRRRIVDRLARREHRLAVRRSRR